MADFTQIIQEINDDINTNGVGAITGAKLNEVLRDMIAAVNAAKQDPLTIDATPTEGSTNPVQSGGVYEALEDKPTIYYTTDIQEIPPTTIAILRVGDIVRFGDDYNYIAVVCKIDNNDVYLAATDGDAVESWLYRNGVSYDFLAYQLSDFANKFPGATQGNLAGLDSDGNLTDSGIAASDVATTSDLAGKQDTISDLSTIRSGAAAGATAVQPSDLATVATSGSYNDLLNKPTIPAAQVNSDWNANSGVAQILNKPTIPDVSGKADKVVGATSGDVATLDSNGNLTDSGLSVFDFFVMVEDASTPPASMAPNTVYKYGTLSGNTTFPALATPTEPDVANVYCWTFTTPATALTITCPSAITSWAGGSALTIKATKNYEVSVLDGIATIIEA